MHYLGLDSNNDANTGAQVPVMQTPDPTDQTPDSRFKWWHVLLAAGIGAAIAWILPARVSVQDKDMAYMGRMLPYMRGEKPVR